MWKIRSASYNATIVDELLKDGWEPFAVTCLGNTEYALIWLRKEVTVKDLFKEGKK